MISLVFGLLILAVFALVANRKWKWYKSCQTADGFIVDVAERQTRNSDGKGSHVTYYAVVEYKLRDSKSVYRFENGLGGTAYKKNVIGNSVKVIYNPSDPHDAKINEFFSIWLLEFVLALLGVLFCICGILVLLNVLPVS